MLIKAKSEHGIVYVEKNENIHSDTNTCGKYKTCEKCGAIKDNDKCERCERIKEKRERTKEICELLKAYAKEEIDKDEAYLKKVEGRYEKYIEKNFPEVLKKTERTAYPIEGKRTVAIIYDEEIILMGNYKIVVYESGTWLEIKGRRFLIDTPEKICENLRYKGYEIKREELLHAILSVEKAYVYELCI